MLSLCVCHQPRLREEETEVQGSEGTYPRSHKSMVSGTDQKPQDKVPGSHLPACWPCSAPISGPPTLSFCQHLLYRQGQTRSGRDQAEIVAFFSHLPAPSLLTGQAPLDPCQPLLCFLSGPLLSPTLPHPQPPSKGPVCAAHFHTRPLGAGLRQGACNSVLWVLLA